MSTPSTCDPPEPRRPRAAAPHRVVLLALLVGVTNGACSTGRDVEAKFRLTSGTVMVFVDDVHERIDWPPARRSLWEDVSQELLRTKSATKVIPLETEESLRQTLPDFARRSAREIGELAGAEQVVWIEAQDFLAEEQITEAANAAYFAVTVKVLNAQEKESRSRVRLWPTSPEGHYLTASMTGAAVIAAKTKDAISRELTAKLAVEIARLFHEHREGDYP